MKEHPDIWYVVWQDQEEEVTCDLFYSYEDAFKDAEEINKISGFCVLAMNRKKVIR